MAIEDHDPQAEVGAAPGTRHEDVTDNSEQLGDDLAAILLDPLEDGFTAMASLSQPMSLPRI